MHSVSTVWYRFFKAYGKCLNSETDVGNLRAGSARACHQLGFNRN
jgi:hypothetical protein